MTKNMLLYWWNEDPVAQPLLKPSYGKVETVWDRYNDLNILETVTDKEVIADFYNARIKELASGCEWSGKTHGYDEDGWPDVADKPSVTAIRFFAFDPGWHKKFRQWLQELVERCDHVVGDDDYFDNYPDLWNIALQICDIQGWLDDYDEAVTNLVEETNFCDPDFYEGQIRGVKVGGEREFFGPARQA